MDEKKKISLRKMTEEELVMELFQLQSQPGKTGKDEIRIWRLEWQLCNLNRVRLIDWM